LRNQQSTEKPLPVLQIQEVYRAGNGVARCEFFIFLICLGAESEIDPLFLSHQLKKFVKKKINFTFCFLTFLPTLD